MSDEDVKKEYAEAGVDLPELKDAPAEAEAKAKEQAETAEKEKAEAEAKAKAEADAHLQETPKEPRKRSIYDDLKDERKTRKDAETRAEQAERDRDALQAKLDAIGEADPGKDRAEATEDAIAYAKKVGADPALVQRIIEDARKGIKPELDENLKKDLEDFKAWKTSNSKTIETQLFNEEFERTLPSLKSYFPNVTDDELKAIKSELDAISHTKEWHDKDLDYIAFKNKDKLSALVSPKKRGMEGKDRKDAPEETFEFDPNADYSKMSPKQRDAWEAEYKKLGKTDGLLTDSQGRKTIL